MTPDGPVPVDAEPGNLAIDPSGTVVYLLDFHGLLLTYGLDARNGRLGERPRARLQLPNVGFQIALSPQ